MNQRQPIVSTRPLSKEAPTLFSVAKTMLRNPIYLLMYMVFDEHSKERMCLYFAEVQHPPTQRH